MSAFGPTIPELPLDTNSGLIYGPFAKTKFGMAIREVDDIINNQLSEDGPVTLVLFGIEVRHSRFTNPHPFVYVILLMAVPHLRAPNGTRVCRERIQSLRPR